jgi:hypothetical protein
LVVLRAQGKLWIATSEGTCGLWRANHDVGVSTLGCASESSYAHDSGSPLVNSSRLPKLQVSLTGPRNAAIHGIALGIALDYIGAVSSNANGPGLVSVSRDGCLRIYPSLGGREG